jgi:hypothetical protein
MNPASKTENNPSAKYELYAQNRNGDLIIKILRKDNYLVRKTDELLGDEKLLQGLPPEQAAFIRNLNNPMK